MEVYSTMKRIMHLILAIMILSVMITPVIAVGPDSVVSELNSGNGLIDDMVTGVVRDDSNNDIYIGTRNGISVYDFQEEEFVSHTNLSTDRNDVRDMVSLPNGGGVYVATNDYPYPVKYYYRLDQFQNLKNYTFNNQFNRTMYDDSLTAISVSSNGSVLCVGIGGGLEGIVVYNRNTLTLTSYNTTNGLISNAVTCILRARVYSDHDWFFIGTDIGTESGAISVFDASDSTFIHFDALEHIESPVRTLLYDSNRLFVGTNDDGVFGFDITSTEATQNDNLRMTAADAWLPSNSIHSLDIDGNQLYIGTHEGLVKYDLVEQESWSTWILDESNDMPDNRVTSLAIVNSGSPTEAKIFAGTQLGGVAVISINYDPSDRERALSEQPFWERTDVQLAIVGSIVGILIAILGYLHQKSD